MKRPTLPLVLATLFISAGWLTAQSADILSEAKAAATDKRFDTALELYEQVFTESTSADDWFEAQKGIALAQAGQGTFPVALQSARLCLDGAPTLRQFDEAVQLTAGLFSAMDQDVGRGNAFLEFQNSGTGDNPIAKIPYPILPGREKRFAALRDEAGDNPEASRMRAQTFLYTGKPREAMAQFADAFRRTSNIPDWQMAGTDLVTMALRVERGRAAGGESDMAFVLYGAAGPDGLPGTPDDLKDPFVGFPTPPVPGQGGLAGLPSEQLDALHKINTAASLYASDPLLRVDLRRSALLALQRSNDALDNWGAPGQEDWYFEQVINPDDAGVVEGFLAGALVSGRGRSLDLSGAERVWKKFAGADKTQNATRSKGTQRLRKQLDAVIKNLRKFNARSPAFKPLSQPATF